MRFIVGVNDIDGNGQDGVALVLFIGVARGYARIRERKRAFGEHPNHCMLSPYKDVSRDRIRCGLLGR